MVEKANSWPNSLFMREGLNVVYELILPQKHIIAKFADSKSQLAKGSFNKSPFDRHRACSYAFLPSN